MNPGPTNTTSQDLGGGMFPRFACRTPKTASAFLIGPLVRLATISMARAAEIATSGGGSCRSNVELFAARRFATKGSTEAGATVSEVDRGEGAVGVVPGDMIPQAVAISTNANARRECLSVPTTSVKATSHRL